MFSFRLHKIYNLLLICPIQKISSRRLQTILQKGRWSFSGKQKIGVLLSILRKENQDLRCLREQGTSLKKSQCRKLDTSKEPSSPGTQASMLAVRDAASQLYDGLATTAARPCHRANLRLQCLEDITPSDIFCGCSTGSSRTSKQSTSALSSQRISKPRVSVLQPKDALALR